MKEVIIRLTSDRIKIKGGEYVQDLVRCKDCKNWLECDMPIAYKDEAFCSLGERKDQ